MSQDEKPHLLEAELPVPPAADQVRCANCGKWINKATEKCCYCGINFLGAAEEFRYIGPDKDPYESIVPSIPREPERINRGALVILILILLHVIALAALGVLSLIR